MMTGKLNFAARMLMPLVAVLLLCSCKTQQVSSADGKVDPVRKVNYKRVPAMKELADHARELGNTMYPRVCTLLLNGNELPPRQFNIVFKPISPDTPAQTDFVLKQVEINSAYFTNKQIIEKQFDKCFVHELAHVAVQSRHWSSLFFNFNPPDKWLNWGESIATYASYKLIGSDGWYCAQCDMSFPHYTSGYTCGGAFLLFLDNQYGSNVIHQIVLEARRGANPDPVVEKITGKSLDSHWTDFQKTPAFKPAALEMWKLCVALGYTNAYEPRNIVKRFDRYVADHADEFTKRVFQQNRSKTKTSGEIKGMLISYVYLTQPGGPAERFLYSQWKQAKLPGMTGEAKGQMVSDKSDERDVFPNLRVVTCSSQDGKTKCRYRVQRTSANEDWKIEKAWKIASDGKQEELPQPDHGA